MESPKQTKSMQVKLAAAKEYLGNKYLLTNPVKRLKVPLK